MLVADLKGKLSVHEAVSEDYLTSAVFSVFRWLPPEWLVKWLTTARNINADHLTVEGVAPVFEFWPWFPQTHYGRGAEPDVVIRLGSLAIIVEAKFRSGKSSNGLVDVEPENSEEDARKIAVDQLARQYFIGQEHCVGAYYQTQSNRTRVEHSIVLYVTKHPSFPGDDIIESMRCVEDAIRNRDGESAARKCRTHCENGIYWTNWQSAYCVLEEARDLFVLSEPEYNIVVELIEFLDRRDLAMFRGFDKLNGLEMKVGQPPVFYVHQDRKYWTEIDAFSYDVLPKTAFYNQTYRPFWLFLGSCNIKAIADGQIFYRRPRK